MEERVPVQCVREAPTGRLVEYEEFVHRKIVPVSEEEVLEDGRPGVLLRRPYAKPTKGKIGSTT